MADSVREVYAKKPHLIARGFISRSLGFVVLRNSIPAVGFTVSKLISHGGKRFFISLACPSAVIKFFCYFKPISRHCPSSTPATLGRGKHFSRYSLDDIVGFARLQQVHNHPLGVVNPAF
ncbi:hypothetical protein J2857_003105 [Neorhizobium galegae]|uniref:hypothetical protein n=1 Tax=Neorhizobium galegae TaxID=399 RepID=UPI001AE9CE2B|nr:hypothetical protein [Neorhizobium galegae]MBP2560336.1 hypothetical protein [Neorhizobium galegae]